MRIWVTKDGNFHLHDANGGEVVERTDVEKTELDTTVQPVIVPVSDTEESNQPQGGEVVERTGKKTGGRPRKSAESKK